MKNIRLLSFITFLTMMLTVTANADSMDMSDKMKMMKHVTPMPPLMMVVRHHEDELSLSDEQKESLASWRTKNGSEVAEMAKKVMAYERSILEATLTGESEETIKKIAADMLEKRKEIIERKLQCRSNMQKILDDEQWKKVVEIYTKEKMQPQS